MHFWPLSFQLPTMMSKPLFSINMGEMFILKIMCPHKIYMENHFPGVSYIVSNFADLANF